MSKEVFISYSSKDYEKVLALKDVLEQNDISCWMAPESIPIGGNYTEVIPEAIENCKVFLLILSRNAQESIWVPNEIEKARNSRKMIIPYMIEDFMINDAFNFMLSQYQRINAYSAYEDAHHILLKEVKDRLRAIDSIDSDGCMVDNISQDDSVFRAESITKSQLLVYVDNVKETETGTFCINHMIRDIDYKIDILQKELKLVSERRWKVPEKPNEPVEPKMQEYPKDNYMKTWIIFIIGVLIFFSIRSSKFGEIFAAVLAIPVLIALPMGIVALVNSGKARKEGRKKTDENNAFLRNRYQEEMKAYPQKLAQYNIEWKNYDTACKNDVIYKNNLSESIDRLHNIKKEISEKVTRAQSYLKTLYSTGIIHEKYHGILPIYRFYEYLDTGICVNLKEAMRTFDNEVAQGNVDKAMGVTGVLLKEKNKIYELAAEHIKFVSSLYDVEKHLPEIMNGTLPLQNYRLHMIEECEKQIEFNMHMVEYYKGIEWIREGGIL